MLKIVILPLLFLLNNDATYSCSCVMQPMGVKKIIQYEYVVLGKVIKKEIIPYQSANDTSMIRPLNLDENRYTIKVEQWIKGTPDKDLLHVYSATQGAACGVNYQEGAELYLFINGSKEKWITGLCAQNMPKEKANKKYKCIIKDYVEAKKYRKYKNINKQLEVEGKIINQLPEGNWTYYHSDKSIASKGLYVTGKKSGAWKFYLSKLRSKEFLKSGKNKENKPIQNPHNILYRILIYDKGKVIEAENIFKDFQ